MAVYKLKKDVKFTNLRIIRKGSEINKDKVAEFVPYGEKGHRIKILQKHKTEVAGPGTGTPYFGGYILNTKKIDTNKKFYLVTSIKGMSHPNLVSGVDLYVNGEDIEYIP